MTTATASSSPSAPTASIAVCLKWTAARDDAGADPDDDRFAGVSAADRAAREVALRLGERWGVPVTALAAGPAGAERTRRDAIAAGADRAVRLDMDADADSRDVAFELAQATAPTGGPCADLVLCGDYSLDRGSGSVPAFIAHHRSAAQALGLVSVDTDGPAADGVVRAVRRLDGGRRELLEVPVPGVLSVEGSVASLRRAPLRRALASRTAPIEVIRTPPAHHRGAPAIVTPYRPRARVMAAPAGDDVLARLRRLTDAGAAPARCETVELAPADAARRIVEALRDWGYLADHDR
ncbi:MAG: mycofactocin-associated electron transfer flavoprotein beta subunit [Actinomycetes bacterium]